MLDRAVPGMKAGTPATSVQLPGVQGLRVDVLAPGEPVGKVVGAPEIDWRAQAIPYYDYLLDDPESGALLAGGHCVPVRLPQPARFVWHKFYSSQRRQGFREKAEKDLRQALVLAQILSDENPDALSSAFADADPRMRNVVRRVLSRLRDSKIGNQAFADIIRACSAVA